MLHINKRYKKKPFKKIYYQCFECSSLFLRPQSKFVSYIANDNKKKRYTIKSCPNCNCLYIEEKQGDILMEKLREGCD